MNAKLAKGITGVSLILVMALAILLPASGQDYPGISSPSDDLDLEAAEGYGMALNLGRSIVTADVSWSLGEYNNSSDYVESVGGRYYVAYYEINGSPAWVSVIGIDSFWPDQADVTWDQFLEQGESAAAVMEEFRRQQDIELGRSIVRKNIDWPAGEYDNSTDNAKDDLYIAYYKVNGTNTWVSIVNLERYQSWVDINDGKPSAGYAQTDLGWREFIDSQQYS